MEDAKDDALPTWYQPEHVNFALMVVVHNSFDQQNYEDTKGHERKWP